MTEGKRKTKKAAGETGSLITVDANKLRAALKHTFEGVTMLFDSLGLDVAVTEAIPERNDAEETQREASPVDTGMKTVPESVNESAPEPVALPETPPAEAPVTPPATPNATAPAAPSVTQDDITRIIVRKIKQDRSNNEKIGAILKTYGVAKVSDLPADKYEAFLTDLSQI